MKGLQEIRFCYRDYVHNTIRVEIKDDNSSYSAIVDYDMLMYALRADLGLKAVDFDSEVKE